MYKLAIRQDQMAENPLTSFDLEPLVILDPSDRHYVSHYEDGKHYPDTPPLPTLSKEQVKELIKGWMRDDNQVSTKQWLRDNYYAPDEWASITDWFNEEYVEERINSSDTLDALEEVYNAANIETYQKYNILVVATPDWLKTTGIDKANVQDSLKATAETYQAWCDGECYGYEIIKQNECHHDDPDTLDSCWGFYTDNHEKSGLLEYARNALEQYDLTKEQIDEVIEQ